jgi:hypothetical protein
MPAALPRLLGSVARLAKRELDACKASAGDRAAASGISESASGSAKAAEVEEAWAMFNEELTKLANGTLSRESQVK